MSETLRTFLDQAQANEWDVAVTTYNGLNMTEMLKGLAALPGPVAETFRQQSAARLGAVNGPRINYALDVFFNHRLPIRAPGDLKDTGQVQDAWNFLQSQQVDERSNPPMGDITVDQLRLVMPHLSQSNAVSYITLLNAAMNGADINTRLRKAAFLAQIAHESVELRYMQEIASGDAYEGRTDLGNTQPGDGRRYKGRGPIQLTGRSNYRAAGADLDLNLEDDPAQVATPAIGFRTSGWFWTRRGLNALADTGNFREITRRINGGYNGLQDRQTFYRRALRAF
jgi:predicted chitinase